MSCSYSCSTHPGELQSNGDIAGLGVVLGFTLTALLSILMVLFYYLFVFDPSWGLFPNEGSSSSPNPVDVCVLRFRRWLPEYLELRRFAGSNAERAFYKCILALADTQVVTGIAILASGWYSFSCGVSVYYWQMVVYLAWFSSLTHLAALTCLRRYFATHWTALVCRLALISALMVLIFVGFIPTGHFNFKDLDDTWEHVYNLGDVLVLANKTAIIRYLAPNDTELRGRSDWINVFRASPAACFLNGDMDKSGAAFLSMVVSLVFLVFGYTVRICKLFAVSSTGIYHVLVRTSQRAHEALLRAWERKLRTMRPSTGLKLAATVLPLQSSVYFLFRTCVDLYGSSLFEVISLMLSASWGAERFANMRHAADKADNEWDFGQVIPLVLLASPLMCICEYFMEARYSRGKQDHECDYPPQPEYLTMASFPFTQTQTFQPYPTPSSTQDLLVTTASQPDLTTNQDELSAEISRLIQDCRSGYAEIGGISLFIVPLTLSLSLYITIELSYIDDIKWSGFAYIRNEVLVYIGYTIYCSHLTIFSLTHLGRTSWRRRWKRLAKFIICGGYATLVPVGYANGEIVAWGLSGSLLANILIGLGWATWKCSRIAKGFIR